MSENVPKIFISYSHDSDKHKEWVVSLATDLISNGIDVFLDQWDTSLGDDLPKYMENSVVASDRVLLICTKKYVAKANEGKGGAGYEAMIVTGELISNLGTNKYIPVIALDNDGNIVPTSMSTRKYISLSNDELYQSNFDDLIREIHGVPKIKKPLMGESPFKVATPESSSDEKVIEHAEDVDIGKESNVSDIYQQALTIAKSGNMSDWRRLVLKEKTIADQKLISWRVNNEQELPINYGPELTKYFLNAIDVYSQIFAIVLAGIESGKKEFSNQFMLFDDVLNPKDWNPSGNTIIVDIPWTIGFIFQALHGAMCMHTSQVDVAINFVNNKMSSKYSDKRAEMWKFYSLVGASDCFGRKSTESWEVIFNITKKWTWLVDLFVTDDNYKESLVAYYMLLNIIEYAELRNTTEEKNIKLMTVGNSSLDIPLGFLFVNEDIKRKAYRLLIQDPNKVELIWVNQQISKSDMKSCWNSWISLCKAWLNRVSAFGYDGSIPQENIFDDI